MILMRRMRRWPIWRTWTGLLLLGGIVVLAASCGSAEQPAGFAVESEQTDHVGPPSFAYDPSWPKALPNNWGLGDVWGVAVDSQDNPWILHGGSDRIRGLLATEGRELAPPIVQFDVEGNVLQAWGGPGDGYDWMKGNFAAEHGMFIDHEDNIWVVGGGTLGFDGGVVLKFTSFGEFLLQIGENGQTNGSHDTRLLGGPTRGPAASALGCGPLCPDRARWADLRL